MIILASDVHASLVSHAREMSPIEACGLLAGTKLLVSRCYHLTNLDESPEHFSMDPKEQFAAVKDMRARGLEMLAIYHSHPLTPAQMSDEDLRLALTPGIAYLIVSLMNPEKPDIKSFRVVEGGAIEEPIVWQELR